MIKRTSLGFSAIELILVICLLGVLVKMAIPRLGAYATATLPTQAQAVADTVRRAQSLAVSRQTLTRLSVVTGVNGSVTVATCATVATCISRSSYALSQDVAVGGAASIYFNSLGTPVDANGIPLTGTTSYPVSFGSNSVNVSVAALTGRVTVGP